MHHKILRAIWSFRIKKKPPQCDKTHEARICADGSKQIEGINYIETHAPVVKWLSVRTMLTMAILNNFKSLAIDFDQAYTQAPIDTEVYMHLPPGFKTDKDEVLKLKKIYMVCAKEAIISGLNYEISLFHKVLSNVHSITVCLSRTASLF